MKRPDHRGPTEMEDDSIFIELVNRYWDVIRNFLTSSILHDDWQEAEDVTQEAFCIAYRKLKDLNDPSAFPNYVGKIAYNIAKKRLKKKNGKGISYVSFDEVDPRELAVSSGEDEMLKREMVKEIIRAIDELPEGEREILREYLLEEKGYRELSREHGLSYHAVVMRVRRAKEKVREKVLKRLSSVVILPWRRIGGMVRCMMEGVTVKVAITGMVAMLVARAGVGIWMSHHGEERATLKAGEVKVERQASVGAAAMVVRKSGEKEEDEFTFEEFNRLIDRLPDGYSDDEAVTAPEEKAEDDRGRDGSIGADETTDEGTRVEGSGGEVERLIQQIRYEQLARLLPRFLELQQEYHDLNKYVRPYIQSLPGDSEERVAFHKREAEICKEEEEIEVELAELFPEAVVYKPYEGPDSPGYFSIDYRKLRELVGGRLPVEPYFRP